MPGSFFPPAPLTYVVVLAFMAAMTDIVVLIGLGSAVKVQRDRLHPEPLLELFDFQFTGAANSPANLWMFRVVSLAVVALCHLVLIGGTLDDSLDGHDGFRVVLIAAFAFLTIPWELFLLRALLRARGPAETYFGRAAPEDDPAHASSPSPVLTWSDPASEPDETLGPGGRYRQH